LLLLTPRQQQVLQALGRGLSNKQVAREPGC
jgi:DNA-binding NarL/FixJ family response regulator